MVLDLLKIQNHLNSLENALLIHPHPLLPQGNQAVPHSERVLWVQAVTSESLVVLTQHQPGLDPDQNIHRE